MHHWISMLFSVRMRFLKNVFLILSILLPMASSLGTCDSSLGRDLRCPSANGVFPAVDSCHSFYSCFGGISTRVDCPHYIRTQVFSPKRKTCVKFIPPINKCHRFRCLNSQQYGDYTGDPTLYAVCRFGTPQCVLQCPYGSYFDRSSQSCIFQCSQEGLVADSSDCTKYWECRWFFGRYQSALRSCPKGSWFDPTIKACSFDGIENCSLVKTTTITTTTEKSPGWITDPPL